MIDNLLINFLDKKPLYYEKFDRKRFVRAYESIKDVLNLKKIIHIVGTNGKGSTGRFLAQILHSNSFSVGHYTSPHIFSFNERFWLNAKVVDDIALQSAHETLLAIFADIRSEDFINSLSYFEWATLLCAVLFKQCDFIIMEAGVGGEFDATNVFDKQLSIFTPIGLDHTSLLGKTLEEIATTKLNSMQDNAIISAQFALPNLALNIAKKKNANIEFISSNLLDCVRVYANKFSLPYFLANNLNLATHAALKLIRNNAYDSVMSLGALDLAGRMQKIDNVIVDVGHNAHAAKALCEHFLSLNQRNLILVYNSFEDKDVESILMALRPVISQIQLYNYESKGRKLASEKIEKIAATLDIDFSVFSAIDKDKNYLVFGSFMLVEQFLRKNMNAG